MRSTILTSQMLVSVRWHAKAAKPSHVTALAILIWRID